MKKQTDNLTSAGILAKHRAGKEKQNAAHVTIAAQELGSLGGNARANSLSDVDRTKIARRAANVRWGNEI